MDIILLFSSVVLLVCIAVSKAAKRLPVPSLLLFLFVGMLFGENGIFRIPFDNYAFTDIVCSVSLIFIMFYGGFDTNLKSARPVIVQAGILACFGTLFTALITGAVLHLVVGLPFQESILIGAVLSSTDAASVFGILKREKLNLKNNTGSLLEIESGANDPMSYMMTMFLCTWMMGGQINAVSMIFSQFVSAAVVSLSVSILTIRLMKQDMIPKDGQIIFMLAEVLLVFAFTRVLQGNGYLAVYLFGITIGNAGLSNLRYHISFFDTLSSIAQMVIFFLLGLLCTPSQLPHSLPMALAVMAVLTLIARPLSTILCLFPFRVSLPQIGLISFAGLRGAASIVFSIMAVLYDVPLSFNLFNVVFCVVLISIALQGTFLPKAAQRLGMIDHGNPVYSFNELRENDMISFIKTHIHETHPWNHHMIRELKLPDDFLIVLIIRGRKTISCHGDTELETGDLVVLSGRQFVENADLRIREITVLHHDAWAQCALKNIRFPDHTLIMMIHRDENMIIPDGNTVIMEGDVLMLAEYD
ncbi:MAG: potassium/proton antiporter [Bulleidia sp.]